MPESLGLLVMVTSHITIDPNDMFRHTFSGPVLAQQDPLF